MRSSFASPASRPAAVEPARFGPFSIERGGGRYGLGLAICKGLVGDRPVDPRDAVFERGLDPGKRAQFGAHLHGPRGRFILQLVEPVVIRPLLAEWAREKAAIAAELERAEVARSRAARMKRRNDAERRYRTFLTRLREFTVLDPACGSGSFLHLGSFAGGGEILRELPDNRRLAILVVCAVEWGDVRRRRGGGDPRPNRRPDIS